MTVKENAERVLEYLRKHDCARTGYFGEKDVEIETQGNVCSIKLFSQCAKITFTFYEGQSGQTCVDVSTTYEAEDGYEQKIIKEFNSFNDFCDWYSCQSYTWTSDLGVSIKSLKTDEN